MLTEWTLSNILSWLYPDPASFTLLGKALVLSLHGGEDILSPFGNVTTFPQFMSEFWRLLEELGSQGLRRGICSTN